MEIFKLFGSIMVDSAEAEKSISKTGKEAESMGSKLASGIKTAGKWAAGVAGAATAVGGAMVAAAKDTAKEMDTIDKASQRMGITAESYQELAYAAELSGVSMSTLEKAAKKLEGTDLNMDEAMAQIMGIEDAGERAAAAAELFGESVAYQMTPLLNAGADGMAAMSQEAHDLGLVMGDEAVKQGAEMNDMFTKVEKSMGQLKNGLIQEFMPYVMQILQWVIENIPVVKETVKSVMDAIMPIVKPVLDAIMKLLPPMLEKIKAFLDWIMPYLTPIIDGVAAFVQGFFALLDGDTDAFIEGIKKLFTNLGESLLGIGEDIMTFLWDGFKKVWEKISGWFTEKIQWVKDKFESVKNTVKNLLSFGGSVDDDGNSHAAGLNYVPYDNYKATLHRGETVLNAQNTQSMVQDITGAIRDALGGNMGASGPIELTLNIDGRAFAQATYDATQREANRRGRALAGVY